MQGYDAVVSVQKFSHIGVCVTSIERSKAFYCQGLGFSEGALVKVNNEHQALLGIPGDLTFHSRFLRLGDVVIELIEFFSPKPLESVIPRPINQFGLTHLSFRVRDVEAVATALESYGGKIIHSTKTHDAQFGGDILFVLDPDGTRVELMSYPDEVQFA